MVGKNINNSVSFPVEMWELIEKESKAVKLNRSEICLKGVELYFSQKNKKKIKHNLTQIVLGINLVLLIFIVVLLL